MNAIATTAPARLGGDIAGLFDAALQNVRAVLPKRIAVADEGLWFVRTLRGGGYEVVPYRRGRLAFSSAAADSLLRLGRGDIIRIREVLDDLAATAANGDSSAALFVAGDSLVVAEYPNDGPALVVTQLA